MTDKEAMQMALDALRSLIPDPADANNDGHDARDVRDWRGAIEALRTALARPEQEPVAWMHTTATGETYFRKKPHDKVFNPKPVYTTLPQREWQGLTDEEVRRIRSAFHESLDTNAYVRAIEQKLKEKNT